MKIRCMYCTKTVAVSKKRLLVDHRDYGDKSCIGSRFNADSMSAQIELRKKNMSTLV